jgi:hypothetical protein
MNSYPPVQRNPVTHQKHRREVFWQITLPLVVGILILISLAVMTGMAAIEPVRRWSDISLIWLTTYKLVFGLINLILLAGLAYGLIRLVSVLPIYARQVQDFFVLVSRRVALITDRLVEPMLKIHSFVAGAQKLGQILRRK